MKAYSTIRVLLLLGIIVGTVGISVASQITLDPSVLPSSQGWDYSSAGLYGATVETDIFSVDGSVLSTNSMGQTIDSFSGGASFIYRQNNVVSSAMPTILEWTSRTLDYESVVSYGEHFGFNVGFSDSSLLYAAGISLNQVTLLDGAGFKVIALDTTAYHTYSIETITGTPAYKFYIDNVLQASATALSGARPNSLYFGDGTGGANSGTDITALEFSQIPEPASIGLIGLFTGSLYFARRFFLV